MNKVESIEVIRNDLFVTPLDVDSINALIYTHPSIFKKLVVALSFNATTVEILKCLKGGV